MAVPGETRPLPSAYWVLPGRFLAGGYPGDLHQDQARNKVHWLLDAGVDFFLDLTEEGELHPYLPLAREASGERPLTYRRMPIGDFRAPASTHMTAILDTIDAALEAGHTLYLHCWAGSGRTGTVVGCYLVRQGMTGEEALAEIGRLRRDIPYARSSPETEEQREMVRQWSG